MSKKKAPVKPQEQAALQPRKLLAGEELLTLQMFLSASDVGIELGTEPNKNIVKLQEIAKVGSFALYNQFRPQDPAEAMLAALSMEVKNATSDCLMEAARTKAHPNIRDMNLKNGFKGALVAAELLDRLDRRRRNDPKAVTVGNVNVEAGGQAIVGNVETRGQPHKAPKPENSKPDTATESTDGTEE
jgi:hypothetical protein